MLAETRGSSQGVGHCGHRRSPSQPAPARRTFGFSFLPAVALTASLSIGLFLVGCRRDAEPPRAVSPEPGESYFKAYCSACHHPEGLGIQGGPPPLLNSPWLGGSDARLIRIVLHGVRGSLKVGERTYDLEMPGFGTILTDAQVAAVLSFVRKRFGRSEGPPNQPPRGPITAAAVSQIRRATRDRSTYWTAEELFEVQ